jgi:formate hydrogenlyase subunit 3/multisubunit Na+/H+ antiporter MnhD subunit
MSYITFLLFLWCAIYFFHKWKKYKRKEYLFFSLLGVGMLIVKISGYLINKIFHFSSTTVESLNALMHYSWIVFFAVLIFLSIRLRKSQKHENGDSQH